MVSSLIRTRRLFALAAACLALAACATLPKIQPQLGTATVADARALDAAVEAFYRASSADALRAAVQAAQQAAPDSGRYHEIAAELARLELREADEFDHLVAAASDLSHDAAAMHLLRLDELSRNTEQHARYLGLLEALSQQHPDEKVKALAAFTLSAHLHVHGDDEGRDAAVRRVSGVLPLAVVGGWDNDQGKGFDIEQPPERGADLSARYEGSLTEIGWEQHPPRDFRGETELREFIAPDRWSVAYGASGFDVPAQGRYELRVSSTDPVKVFVDGTLVLEAREVEGVFTLDQFIVPVVLEAGTHQLLIKSAHRTGDWRLFARVTGPRGAPVAVTARPASPYTSALAAVKLPGEQGALAAHVGEMPESARRARHVANWASYVFGTTVSVRAAQEFARRVPGSVVARYELISALWTNGERGRTADELAELDRALGVELPLIRKQQARFWIQEGLKSRARKALLELAKAHPDRPAATRQLAELYDAEKWIEDRCRTLEALNERSPETLDLQLELAQCWDQERREDRAITRYRELLARYPRHLSVLRQLHAALRDRGRLDEATDAAKALIRAFPEKLWPRLELAETLRRQGEIEAAQRLLADARARFPSSADVRRAEATLAWRQGDEKTAIEAWQAALALHPDDEATANRLDFLAPAATGPWAADVPTEELLDEAVKARAKLEQKPGADLAYLVDHEVTQLRSDGSTINVVTHVVHAFSQAGRDKLTRRRLGHGGRSRVLHAYAIDPKGRRSEASVRSREVLFRGLEVGSTIVLQYRADSPPSGFLPRYLSRSWSFQSANEQRRNAEFVLWRPQGTALQEYKLGELKRDEKKVGDEVRVSWSLAESDPVLPEPNMPPAHEVMANLQITTVPGWDAFEKWEDALMEGALRDSPEIEQLAAKIGEGATTVEEKLFRIHEYVMEEIRYQQDYESFIAGVKPHPASMVVERRYGDCKDKTVLFMSLAKQLGIEAHFATVRTRDRGQVRKELPTQQFNHAIVYVPPQPGYETGRFFDSTADALDIDVLRDDNAGTEAFVYSPVTRKHTWIPIPWQTTGHHSVRTEIQYALSKDGTAQGQLVLQGRGRAGAAFRRIARNPEQFKQVMQMVAGSYFAGASAQQSAALEVKDLRQPAVVTTHFSAPNAARKDGDGLRVRLPTDWSPKSTFNLASRKFPLILGTPNEQHWKFEVKLPEGMSAARLPSSGEVATECLVLKRAVTPTATGISVEQSLQTRCERISPQEYPAYRTQVEQMIRFLDEELVLEPTKAPVVKPAKATRAK